MEKKSQQQQKTLMTVKCKHYVPKSINLRDMIEL